MRKFLLMASAALGLALAAPATASAIPLTQGAAINLAMDTTSPVVDVAWHCRAWSGWCRGYWGPRWHRRHWRRWRRW